jgi:hypothetical protein
MSKEAIIEKIKKLLRMKRGGTAGEIENALAAAAKLAREHDIDLESVNPDERPAQPIGHIDAVTAARLQWEYKYAALVCKQFFHVDVMIYDCESQSSFRRRDFRLALIGTAHDTQIAIYVLNFLVAHFRRQWNLRDGRCIRNRQSFFYGMYHGLCSKLDEERKQAPQSDHALVHVERAVALREQYTKEQWPNAGTIDTKPDNDARNSKNAGYVAGRNTNIRPAVNGAPAAQRPALPPAMGQLSLI